MTKEEMAKVYAEGYECYEDENYKKIAYDAFLCGFTAKCESCILPDIDKAAKKIYPMTTTPPTPIEVAAYYNAAQQRAREAFKTGVKWSKEQMIKITKDNNLDEAAEKYAIQGHENHTNVNYINTYIEGKRIGFIAGAEWMAGQMK